MNWERIHVLQNPGGFCTYSFPLVEPDPAVRERIYLNYGCFAGRSYSVGFTISVSDDLWTSVGRRVFSSVGRGTRDEDPLVRTYPRSVTFSPDGQRGIAVVDRNPLDRGGDALIRSEDGGQSWRIVLDYPLGGEQGPTELLLAPRSSPSLAPTFVGLSGEESGVLVSEDGGERWSTVGTHPIGSVRALAYLPVHDVLFAATDSGLWRIARPAAAADHPTTQPRDASPHTRG
jgi:hypothetical protein